MVSGEDDEHLVILRTLCAVLGMLMALICSSSYTSSRTNTTKRCRSRRRDITSERLQGGRCELSHWKWNAWAAMTRFRKGSRHSEVSSRRHKPGGEIFEDGTGVIEAHVLGPVDRLHALFVSVLRVSATREQPLHQLGLIADCGVEETGPAGLHHPPWHVREHRRIRERYFCGRTYSVTQ